MILQLLAKANNELAQSVLSACQESSIYLMGVCFILGSMFTVLTLVLLDWVRARRGA